MSLRITRPGMLDTVQDGGRPGYQHFGINPGGAMDRYSAQLGNALLGIDLDAPVLELHFPAAHIFFEKAAIICLTGADFSAAVNGHPVPLNHPVAVAKNALLTFPALRWGCRAYLSISQGLRIKPWLGSASTHLKAAAGGFSGRPLQKDDRIFFAREGNDDRPLPPHGFHVLPWKAMDTVQNHTEIGFVIGSEWNWLDAASRRAFETDWYQLTAASDRMGYRLCGNPLAAEHAVQLVSSGVCFGTVQLLPDGQLIVLMADHQTTGGYPRIAQVISAHLPVLAQKRPNDVIRFTMIRLEEAEKKLIAQKKYLQQLQIACKFRMDMPA